MVILLYRSFDLVIVLINTISVVDQLLQSKGYYLCWGDHGSVEFILVFVGLSDM